MAAPASAALCVRNSAASDGHAISFRSELRMVPLDNALPATRIAAMHHVFADHPVGCNVATSRTGCAVEHPPLAGTMVTPLAPHRA